MKKVWLDEKGVLCSKTAELGLICPKGRHDNQDDRCSSYCAWFDIMSSNTENVTDKTSLVACKGMPIAELVDPPEQKGNDDGKV